MYRKHTEPRFLWTVTPQRPNKRPWMSIIPQRAINHEPTTVWESYTGVLPWPIIARCAALCVCNDIAEASRLGCGWCVCVWRGGGGASIRGGVGFKGFHRARQLHCSKSASHTPLPHWWRPICYHLLRNATNLLLITLNFVVLVNTCALTVHSFYLIAVSYL